MSEEGTRTWPGSVRHIYSGARRAMPWPELARDASRYGWPLASLMRQIAESPYAAGVHGCISMDGLLIAQTPEIQFHGPYLQIQQRRDGVHFEYVEDRSVKSRWRRVCSAEDAFARFERFLHLQKWIVHLPPAGPPPS